MKRLLAKLSFIFGAVIILAACSKTPLLTSATINRKAVSNADLPAFSKVIDECRSKMGYWIEDLPPGLVEIQVALPEKGPLRYFYSPGSRAMLWLDNPQNRKFGCYVSPKYASIIDDCYARAQ